MTHRFGLFPYRQMLLGILGRDGAFSFGTVGDAPDIDKFFRHRKVEAVAGYTEKLDQRQFDFLVSGCLVDRFAIVVVGISFKEHFVDMAGVGFSYPQPFIFAGGLIIGDGAFIHMTHII